MSEETEGQSSRVEVGCIAALCVALTVIIAMLASQIFPDMEITMGQTFFGGGMLFITIFSLAAGAYMRKAKRETQDISDDEAD